MPLNRTVACPNNKLTCDKFDHCIRKLSPKGETLVFMSLVHFHFNQIANLLLQYVMYVINCACWLHDEEGRRLVALI